MVHGEVVALKNGELVMGEWSDEVLACLSVWNKVQMCVHVVQWMPLPSHHLLLC